MRKFSDINESVWGDIRKRAEGTDERKEDDIDNLGGSELYDYLNTIYEQLEEIAIMYAGQLDIIQIAIYKDHNIYHHLLYHNIEMEKPYISLYISEEETDMLNALSQVFSVTTFEGSDINFHIDAKNNEKTTNKFFIKVIDTILDNAKGSIEPLIRKK